MLRTLVRRAAIDPYTIPHIPKSAPKSSPSKITLENNPFQSKRSWPPEFSSLSQKHQFRLERRYRRRAKLKWARPTWTKSVKLAQWASIIGVLVYGVLFMQVGDAGQEGTPFDGIRAWYREQIDSLEVQREKSSSVPARAPERTVGQEKANSGAA